MSYSCFHIYSHNLCPLPIGMVTFFALTYTIFFKTSVFQFINIPLSIFFHVQKLSVEPLEGFES